MKQQIKNKAWSKKETSMENTRINNGTQKNKYRNTELRI